jgi:serine protease Do
MHGCLFIVAKQLVGQLQTHLGISGTLIPDVYQRYYKLPKGIYVSQVKSGSEAQEKGMVAGDIITHINNHEIQDDRYLNLLSSQMEQGESVVLLVYRSGTQVEITLSWGNY